MNRNLLIGIIAVISILIVIGVVVFVIIPLSQPHNPETIALQF